MSARSKNSGATLGVAISPRSVTAAGSAMPTVWQREVEVNGGSNGTVEHLRAALADAARASGSDAPATVVALLAPLVELRTISLPPLTEEDRNRFLVRNASRYFVSARGAQVIGSSASIAEKGAASMPVLAAAASQQLVAAVQNAANEAGVPLVGVVPAESAWAAAALEIWPAFERGAAAVAVTRDDRTDVISLQDGDLVAVRRFRGPAEAAEIVSATNRGRIGILGPSSAARAMASALSAAGAQVSVASGQWQAMSEHPEAIAARFAPSATGLSIRTEESREVEREQIGAFATRILLYAVPMLIVAGLTYYTGVKRELQHVQAARAAIKPQVEQMLVGRSSVETAYRQVAGLAKISREAPRWSAVLAALAAGLPDHASLSAFRARGDSIFLDGVAEQAAPIFDDIARTPGVTGVRATAPVRRESPEGETPLEHFAIGAQLKAAPAPAPAPRRPR